MEFKPLLKKRWKEIRPAIMAVILSVMGTGLLFAQPVPPVCGPGPAWIQNCSGGTDAFATSALVGLDLDPYDGFCLRDMNLVLTPISGNTDEILRSNPKDVITNPLILPPGPDCPIPTADGILDVIETEMLSLDISTGGGISLRAGSNSGAPVPATYGAIIEVPGNDSCGCSYFDVYFEVTTPCGPVYNHSPLRVTSIIKKVPPEAIYLHPVGLCIDLFPTPPGTTSWPVAQLVDALHLAQMDPVLGCTDPAASNYDPTATIDDGSCCYPIYGPGSGWFQQALLGPPGTDELFTGAQICVNLNPSNCIPNPADLDLNLTGFTGVLRLPNPPGNTIQTEIISMNLQGLSPLGPVVVRAGNDAPSVPPSQGFMNPGSDPFFANAFFDVFVEIEIELGPGDVIKAYNHQPVQVGAEIEQIPPMAPLSAEFVSPSGICIPIFDVPPGSPAPTPIGNIVKTIHFPKIVAGCTDPAALNYNPSATFDNGSCVYPSSLCEPPNGTHTTDIWDNRALLRWNPVLGASSYVITGKPCAGGPNSIVTITVPGTACEYLATGLLSNYCYEWVIQVNGCPAFGCGLSAMSPINTFNTPPRCKAPNPISTTNITTNSAKLNWFNDGNCASYTLYGRQVGSSVVSFTLGGASSMYTATGLSSGTSYEWSIACNCLSGEVSPLATPQLFTTLGATQKGVTEFHFGEGLITSVYPNPAKDRAEISWYGIDNSRSVDILIYDISGRLLRSHENLSGTNTLSISTADMPNGLYSIIVKSEIETKIEKLIIAR